MTETEISGNVIAGFEPLADQFADVLDRSHGQGAALHIRLDGTVVADLWGGSARDGTPWTRDTPSVIFSCTKGLTSILVGELVKDRLLDLDEPVSTYWPEFSGGGKEALSVRAMLAHRAGIPVVREDLQKADILDWDRMARTLAAEQPFFPPGETHAYHALTFGWLAGELVRRLTGMSVGAYFADRVTRPLHVDAWIGIGESEMDRVAELSVPDGYGASVQEPEPEAPDLIRYANRALNLGHAIPSNFADPGVGFNDPAILQAEIAGAAGVASARALATIWSATVSDREKVRLLSPPVIHDMRHVQSEGPGALPGPPPWHRWGSGFMLNSEYRPFLSDSSFGHDGLGGQVGFGDENTRLGFGFLTNDLQLAGDRRAADLVITLRDILK